MQTFPLESLNFEQAMQKQFLLIEKISKYFSGSDFLNLGDLGLNPEFHKPKTTTKVEQIIADFFNAEQAILLQGAGTGAIRSSLMQMIKPNETLLLHEAPIYPTTKTIIEQLQINPIFADFNQPKNLAKIILDKKPMLALIQHSRQKPSDSYNLQEIIEIMNEHHVPSLIDDNYATMKVDKIGCELGATVSTFSSFKLFGPPGIGIAVGKTNVISKIQKTLYSGGCQVQGFQAIEVLQGLVFAPIMHAVQAKVNDELLLRLSKNELPFIKKAFLANAQSKVLLVEFHENIAKKILLEAEKLGALPYPVGAESKFELLPLFYRVSGTFLHSDPSLENRMIRINPNRSGANLIISILQKSYNNVKKLRNL